MRRVTKALLMEEMEWFKNKEANSENLVMANTAISDCQNVLQEHYENYPDCPATKEEYKLLFDSFNALRVFSESDKYFAYNVGIEQATDALYRFLEKEV